MSYIDTIRNEIKNIHGENLVWSKAHANEVCDRLVAAHEREVAELREALRIAAEALEFAAGALYSHDCHPIDKMCQNAAAIVRYDLEKTGGAQ